MVDSESPFQLAHSSMCHRKVREDSLFLLLTSVEMTASVSQHSMACGSPRSTGQPHYPACHGREPMCWHQEMSCPQITPPTILQSHSTLL